MKTMTKASLALLALGTSAALLIAQDAADPTQTPRGREMRPHRPPPLIGALDVNRDGVIDQAEIDNAPVALRTLDKNGDGQLTIDELMGRPPMPRGPRHQGPPPHAAGEESVPAPDGN